MGEVYRARDPKLDRDVAIKVLPAALVGDGQYMTRFEREARMLAALNHPNIATVYGIEQGALVMELVDGADLKGPMPVEEAIAIARQIAAGLEAAHEKGIVHRDLKPANIKLTPAGVVKILDFGLARSSAESGAPAAPSATASPTLSLELTRAGTILGTAAYMSPEQARGKPVDRRTDIWSFGVVLYEIVTGKRLFDGESVTETLASVVKDHPDLTGVPESVRRLLERCLEKDPKKRLRDIGDTELLLAAAPAASRPRSPKRDWLGWMVAAVLAFALGGLAFVAAPHFREKPGAPVKFQIPPPEKGALDESATPAVSPDGRRIAFRANVDGNRMVWVRDLGSLDVRMLLGTQNAGTFFWSPDSRQLAFVQGGKLMKIDVAGGPATTLVSGSVGAYGGAWNQEGVILFVKDLHLFRVAAAGGTPSPVTELDKSREEVVHAAPAFLPDGRHFLYVVFNLSDLDYTACVGDLQSKDKKLLVQRLNSHVTYVDPGYLLFARDHVLMAQPFDAGKLQTMGDAVPVVEEVDTAGRSRYYSASPNGTLAYASGGAGTGLQITWYDRSGKVVGTVGKPVEIQTPRLSPNGKIVASDRVDTQTRRRDIWLTDLVRGGEQRLTFAGQNSFPVWSPDSLRVAYFHADQNGEKVLVKSADGTGQPEVLESPIKRPMDWTRDGRYLILATSLATPKTSSDLWALPLSGAKPAGKPVPLRETEFAEWHGRVSPDGRWLAYDSDDTKRREVYVVGFSSLNGHWQVSVDGARDPVWSRDGRELYFVGLNGKMMAVEIEPGPQFEASVPKPLFDVRLGAAINFPSYDVSADGRFLIATRVEQTATVPMTVMLNWQAPLKK